MDFRNLKEKEDSRDRTYKNKEGRSIYFDFSFTDADRRSIAREQRSYKQDFRCEIFNDESMLLVKGYIMLEIGGLSYLNQNSIMSHL